MVRTTSTHGAVRFRERCCALSDQEMVRFLTSLPSSTRWEREGWTGRANRAVLWGRWLFLFWARGQEEQLVTVLVVDQDNRDRLSGRLVQDGAGELTLA